MHRDEKMKSRQCLRQMCRVVRRQIDEIFEKEKDGRKEGEGGGRESGFIYAFRNVVR